MTPLKEIKPTDINCICGAGSSIIYLSWGIKNTLHKMARATVHPLHVFDYDNVVIIKNDPVKLKGTVKLYEASYDVLLRSGKKVRHSLCNISLTKEYRPHIVDLVRK